MKGFIVYPSSEVKDNKQYVYLFGRLENGETFLTVNHFRPYFYIKTADRKKAEKLEKNADYKDTDFVNFATEKVTKVILNLSKDIVPLRNLFADHSIVSYEADIRYVQRFLIDKDIKGALDIDGDYERPQEGTIDRIYHEPTLKPVAEYFPKLKVLSIDIETNKRTSDLYAIALYTPTLKKVLILKKGTFKNAESFTDEERLLERFKELFLEIDPDIVTGWNFIDFDLKYLQERFRKYKIEFKLGRINWPCKIRISDSYFKDSTADIPGRMILDGIHLLKISHVKLDDYKLSTASKLFLGEDKIFTGPNRYDQIDAAYEKDPQLLIDYNLKDAQLAYDMIEKSNALNLTIRRSLLNRLSLDKVQGSIAALDSLYLKELQKIKVVAPTAAVTDRDERIKGGFVLEPQPGIYDNIIILDFKSLYPSIMRTFNIDPLTHMPAKSVKNKKRYIEAPNGALFKNEDGVLSNMIQQLWEARDAAKKRKDPLATYAIKIMMNSIFGVMANPACRFYSLDLANAITSFGRFFIQQAAKKAEEWGYHVIYGDTDSCFIDLQNKNYKEAVTLGIEIAQRLNKYFSEYVQKNYKKKSFLEVQFEKVFKKFFLPHIRKKEEGAKKRYAGLVEKDGKEDLQFVGLETVRRDWTALAKKLQQELLDRVFHNQEITMFIRKFVHDLKEGKYDDLLVYRKGIRKGVEEYTKTTPPHIKAARKMGRSTTGIIEYVQTINGPEAVEAHTSPIDYDHYIKKQLQPIADSILVLLGKTFEDILKDHKQYSLEAFK
ncbi:DNA polymerase II [Candidatus Woesearchaeota archaeon]|nr:DNA polymerase II [Candidatus Woesearchaeota archaeon]